MKTMKIWEGVKQIKSRIICDVDLIVSCRQQAQTTLKKGESILDKHQQEDDQSPTLIGLGRLGKENLQMF